MSVVEKESLRGSWAVDVGSGMVEVMVGALVVDGGNSWLFG